LESGGPRERELELGRLDDARELLAKWRSGLPRDEA
jgi:hypothetical protein